MMTTLKISVKRKRDAILLYKMLQKLSFVDHIEKSETGRRKTKKYQFSILRNILKEKSSPGLFVSIGNPVQWQQNLRDEWE
jgi:hypothetical protein